MEYPGKKKKKRIQNIKRTLYKNEGRRLDVRNGGRKTVVRSGAIRVTRGQNNNQTFFSQAVCTC